MLIKMPVHCLKEPELEGSLNVNIIFVIDDAVKTILTTKE